MLTAGLLITVYIAYVIKSPAVDAGLTESGAVEFINKYEKHFLVVKLLGDDLEKWNYWQMCQYLQHVIWMSYFHYSLAISRLLDQNPFVVVYAAITQVSNKSLKAMQMFETMAPIRSKEKKDEEYSEEVKWTTTKYEELMVD